MVSEVDSNEGVLQGLRLMPECILREAAAGHQNLEGFLWYPTNIFSFAERLVSIAGLAAMAIYTDYLLAYPEAAERDQIMEDYLRTILFDRGYGRGLACAIIDHCGLITRGPLAKIVEGGRPLTRLITSRPESPGNLARNLLSNPPAKQLAALVRGLRFLRDFSFTAEGRIVRFRRKKLETSPFLLWDGRDVWRFRRITQEESQAECAQYLSAAIGDESQEVLSMDSQALRRVSIVGSLLGMNTSERLLREDTPSQEAMPQSFMPLFADSHPDMSRLADRLCSKASPETRFNLWVSPLVGADRKQGRKLADNRVFVTNAILKQCMDRDPISVLEEFFIEEPREQERYFTHLVHDAAEQRKHRRQIEREVEEYEQNLAPFYCQHQEELKDQVKRRRMRLVAQRIVRLSGFEIIENVAQEDLNDYRRRARAFHRYLTSPADEKQEDRSAKVRGGLLACALAVETILKTILMFYSALRWYDPNHPHTLDDAGTVGLAKAIGKMRKPLGPLISDVWNLESDKEVMVKINDLLGRSRLWPERSDVIPLKALKAIKDWRNQVHYRPPRIDAAAELVAGFIHCLDWLQDARPHPGQSWQIFPALLSLNLVTTNNCGISSTKYTLAAHDEERHQITLYTRQLLSANSGSFFGLPHLEKTIKNQVWVDPVLIPSALFRMPEPPEATSA
jgi:hypothetical protein